MKFSIINSENLNQKLMLFKIEIKLKMSRNDIDNFETDTVCKYFTWKEVEAHATQPECWIVVHDGVYDLAKFKRKHPGGAKLLGHFAGQDATVCTISHFKNTFSCDTVR